jgi:hypothetical protein
VEDDLDDQLGEWTSGPADADQFTLTQRARRAWARARGYLQKHWGIGYPREAKARPAAAGGAAEAGAAPKAAPTVAGGGSDAAGSGDAAAAPPPLRPPPGKA